MDRRATFFLGAAVVSVLLIPATDLQFRWVPVGLAAVYVILAGASWVDWRTRQASQEPAPIGSWMEGQKQKRHEEDQVDASFLDSGAAGKDGESADDRGGSEEKHLGGAQAEHERPLEPNGSHGDGGDGEPDARHR
jgi:hypothetical protein